MSVSVCSCSRYVTLVWPYGPIESYAYSYVYLSCVPFCYYFPLKYYFIFKLVYSTVNSSASAFRTRFVVRQNCLGFALAKAMISCCCWIFDRRFSIVFPLSTCLSTLLFYLIILLPSDGLKHDSMDGHNLGSAPRTRVREFGKGS